MPPWFRSATVVLTVSVASAAGSVVHAAEWTSRTGVCFEYEGTWVVEQEQSGTWFGHIDFAHVGGPCSPARNDSDVFSQEVRAAIVGKDFFARRTTGAAMCVMYGQVRPEGGVSGYEVCTGITAARAFAVRFAPAREGRPAPKQ